jgi:hypothetical protein
LDCNISDDKRQRLEIVNMFLHIASICQYTKPFQPALLSIGGNEQIEKRLAALGFKKTGHKLRNTQKNLWHLQDHDDADKSGLDKCNTAKYLTLTSSMNLLLKVAFRNDDTKPISEEDD